MQVSTIRPTHLFGAVAIVVLTFALFAWAPWSAQARGAAIDSPRASTVAMNCAPGQQALVRQALVGGEIQVAVECADTAAAVAAARSEFHPGLTAQPAAVQMVPAVYRAPVQAPVYTPQVVRQPQPVAARRVEPKSTWKKDALIIGGSAGAGAGIGGLIGGKKGALIGAAIGGGGAAITRAVKR